MRIYEGERPYHAYIQSYYKDSSVHSLSCIQCAYYACTLLLTPQNALFAPFHHVTIFFNSQACEFYIHWCISNERHWLLICIKGWYMHVNNVYFIFSSSLSAICFPLPFFVSLQWSLAAFSLSVLTLVAIIAFQHSGSLYFLLDCVLKTFSWFLCYSIIHYPLLNVNSNSNASPA